MAFLQFAEPLLGAFGPQPTETQMEQPLRIAFMVWNTVVYMDAVGKRQPMDTLRELSKHDAQLAALIDAMIDRKRNLFGDDQRLIGDYSLFRQDGEIRLRAEARDPFPTSPNAC